LHWDSGWYLTVIRDGYTEPFWTGMLYGQANYAFFPLYPYTVRLLANVIPAEIAGTVVSTACLFAGSVFLHLYCRERHGESAARMAVISLNAFPGSFIFSSLMTEAMFLMLTVGSAYFALRNGYLAASVLAGLAGITRPLGIILTGTLLLDWFWSRIARLRQPIDWRDVLYLCLAPIPVFLFMLYLYLQFGDAFAFSNVQYFWQRPFGNPFNNLFLFLDTNRDAWSIFTSFFVFVSLILLLVCSRHLTAGELIFTVISILVPLSTGLMSIPRFIVALYPIHAALGAELSRHGIRGALVGAMAMVNGFMMTFWSIGHHVLV
jgi:hypothetical protein